MWKENTGDVIVYTWSQFIKEEALTLLGFSSSVNVDEQKLQRLESIKKCNGSNNNKQSEETSASASEGCDTSNSNKLLISCKQTEDSQPESSIESKKEDSDKSPNSSLDIQGLDDRAVQDIGPRVNLLVLLRDYDQEMHKKQFSKKMFCCNVCFCDKIGSVCLEFWPCGHVYCKECMKGYFEVQIKEGNVKFLRCPNDKCASEANPKQV